MTDEAKLSRLKILLGPDDIPTDNELTEYLLIAEEEILNWLYVRTSVPEGAVFPSRYDNTQIMAVVAAVNIIGAEGETLHIENGTHRQFKYDDLLAYIRAHVQPYVMI